MQYTDIHTVCVCVCVKVPQQPIYNNNTTNCYNNTRITGITIE